MAHKHIFQACYEVIMDFNKRVKFKGITVTNYKTQSIANRGLNSDTATGKMVIERGDFTGEYEVTLANNWMPSRDGSGLDGESCSALRSQADDAWQKWYHAGDVPEKMAREALAWIIYILDQVESGKVISAENTAKVGMLQVIVKALRIKTIEVAISPTVTSKEKTVPLGFVITHDAASIRGLINFYQPKLDLVQAMEYTKTAGAKTPRASSGVYSY